jgi:hypothetical protein
VKDYVMHRYGKGANQSTTLEGAVFHSMVAHSICVDIGHVLCAMMLPRGDERRRTGG